MCNQQPNNANIFHRLQVGKIGARKSTATLGSALAKPFPRPLKGTIILFDKTDKCDTKRRCEKHVDFSLTPTRVYVVLLDET